MARFLVVSFSLTFTGLMLLLGSVSFVNGVSFH